MPRRHAITTQAVRNELSGSGLSVFLSALGNEAQQKTVIDEHIIEAQEQIESETGIYFFEEIIKSKPVDPGLVRGVDYTRIDDSYPFVRMDWQTYGRIKARRKPIKSVQRVALRYGQGSQVLEAVAYPESWVSFDGRLGIVNVIPIMGSVTYGAGAMIFLPITGGAIKRDILPDLVTVDYTAGFLPADFDRDVDDPLDASPDFEVSRLLKAVRLLAAASVLTSVQRAVGAGGGSIAMWGLSESFNAGRFQQEIGAYKSEVEELKTSFLFTAAAPMVFST